MGCTECSLTRLSSPLSVGAQRLRAAPARPLREQQHPSARCLRLQYGKTLQTDGHQKTDCFRALLQAAPADLRTSCKTAHMQQCVDIVPQILLVSEIQSAIAACPFLPAALSPHLDIYYCLKCAVLLAMGWAVTHREELLGVILL